MSCDFDKEAQSDEMMVLESIFDSYIFNLNKSDSSSGTILIPQDTVGEIRIKGRVTTTSEIDGKKITRKLNHSLSHLPPLYLHFMLPSNYPSVSKPTFTLSSSWLDRKSLSKLCAHLDEIWEAEKGSAVLYSWYTFLKESLSYLGIQEEIDISWAYLTPKKLKNNNHHSQTHCDSRAVYERHPTPLLDHLIQFNIEEKERVFITTRHSCSICFSDKIGEDFTTLLPCSHFFCTECLSEYFKNLVVEGNLDGIKCPDLLCDTAPQPSQVKRIVGDEIFERYDALLLKRTLENMTDVAYCPLPNCNCPVLADPVDKLAKCPKCSYSFCSVCKSVYHGVEPCRFKADERKELYEKYIEGTGEEKKLLEKTYGKKQLDLLIQTVLSEKWVSSRSKPCPHCSVPIDKFEGCNKVTCFKCNTFFCWLCSSQLDSKNPYLHFNDPSSKCFNTLFMDEDNGGEGSSDEDEDYEWGSDDSDGDLEFEDFD